VKFCVASVASVAVQVGVWFVRACALKKIVSFLQMRMFKRGNVAARDNITRRSFWNILSGSCD
jgi:hypothetical protein